jgi:hypothetical protein
VTKYWKAILAAAGGLTGATVVAIANAIGADITPEAGAAIATLLALVAVRFGPRNTTPPAEWAGLDEEAHPMPPVSGDV